MAKGYLIVRVYADTISQPVAGATVTVKGDNYENVFITDDNGHTIPIELNAPDRQYSLIPQKDVKPYSQYEVSVVKEGLQTTIIKGVQILPEEISIQNVFMSSVIRREKSDTIISIPDHTLWEVPSPKIPEDPTKELGITPFAFPRVLIPEYIIVHDGIPSDTNASNYYVLFPDYIKNVASSEIYSTWPTETLKANVHAIVSFTLNRVFTEWYRSRGYNFTITSSPKYDQVYIHNRTIFKSISDVVDEYFTYYIRLINTTWPFFAQYNDGIETNNPGWLSQWGSKELGAKGYKAIDILKYFYTDDLTLQSAEKIEGLPLSFPGYNLELDSCGEPVQRIQIMLNTISGSYPVIPKISPADGRYQSSAINAVRKFQEIFDLPITGVVDFATWYKISYVYVAVMDILQGIAQSI